MRVVSTQHRGALVGERGVDASLRRRGVGGDGNAVDTRHRERGWGGFWFCHTEGCRDVFIVAIDFMDSICNIEAVVFMVV